MDHKSCAFAHVVPLTALQLRGKNVHHAIGCMAARIACGHRAKYVHCRIGHMGDGTLHSQSQQQEMVYISSKGFPTCQSLINIKLTPNARGTNTSKDINSPHVHEHEDMCGNRPRRDRLGRCNASHNVLAQGSVKQKGIISHASITRYANKTIKKLTWVSA